MDELTILIAMIAILIIEYILGKTKIVEPNSIIETILFLILKLAKALTPGK